MLSVIEKIAVEIMRRLERISIDNGYVFTPYAVTRPKRQAEDLSPEDGNIQLTQKDSVRNEDMSHPGNPPAIAYDVEFEINCFVRTSDFEDSDYDTIQNDRCCQVVKAITNEAEDPNRWYTFDDNAIIADFGSFRPYPQSDGNHNGITIPLMVTYRVSENNHYQVRA